MEQLAIEQKRTGEEIQSLIRNYKKDSDTRKTRAYFEKRLYELSSAWDQFETTDNKIRTLENVPIDHPYFRSEYYKEISDLVHNYENIFKEKLSQIIEKDAKVQAATGPKELQEPIQIASFKDHPSQKPESAQVATIIRRQKAMIATIQRHLDSISDEVNPQSVRMTTSSITKLWDQIENLHYAILELNDDPHEYQQDSFIEMEKLVREAQLRTATLQSAHQNQTSCATISPSVRLPKVTIPTFDGDYLKWGQFCDMFTQMVHNQSIPAIQKMWYLKTNLAGEAEKLIRHLALTEQNYASAWNLIQERYNNIRVLTSAIISKVMSTPAIVSETPSSSAVKNLHDTIHECLLALSNLGVDVSSWDPLLLHFLVKKLDRQSHTLYEQSIKKPKENQSIRSFLDFLEFRFQSLEVIGQKEKSSTAKALTSTTPNKGRTSCIICQQAAHPVYACKQFLQMSAATRLQCAQKHRLCVNCLRVGHRASACTLRACSKCNQKHNTLLHLDPAQGNGVKKDSPKPTQPEGQIIKPSSLAAYSDHERHSYILLGTAKVLVKACNGRTIACRTLLDSGSQVNLVTERLVRRLGLSPKKASLQIEGIGGASRSARQRINLEVQSRLTQFSTTLEAFILPEIVSKQPAQYVDISSWPIPSTVSLADPTFNQPEHVDMLLGAEVYHELLAPGLLKLSEATPILQNTVFGWVMSGKVDQDHMGHVTCGVFTAEEEMTSELVERFWRIDEVTDHQPSLSVQDKKCEIHFVEHTTRLQNGRFMVRLPFQDEPSSLGETRRTAFNRLCALEKRLAKDSTVMEQYKDFMREYESLGHMTRISAKDVPERHYVIPHHCVLKPESTSTKLRVVFDASSKSSSGSSLNDILHTGPTVQPELFTILLRFRLPTYVFTADIQKMYRQILLHPEDRAYQIILWRENPSEPMRYYQLNTVTYGTRSAPYLATKCLQKLAQNNRQRYPLGSVALEDHFYVDDGLVGSNSLVEALEMQRQLTELLGLAGFRLHKWCANHKRLLDLISPEHREVSLDLEEMQANSVKTLGMIWRPGDDQFLIRVNQQTAEKVTKRTVTSELARIFDPLGILAPVVVTAKIFIQRLWRLTISWDDPLPPDHERSWRSLRSELNSLQDIKIPRHVFTQRTPKSVQIHVFADASQKAYGAAIYVRSTFQNGQVAIKLLCAKSRVAPLKTQTLPRLELCAALVGVQLASRVKRDLKFDNHTTFFWTDSEIVLAWINSSSSSFQTFVANRVARIQEGSLASQWRHVRSADNPADALSRGLPARSFASSSLWFYGPLFLHGRESLWPTPFRKTIDQVSRDDSSELKKKQPEVTVAAVCGPNDTIYGINHRNSFVTLQRIVAYMLRFTRHLTEPKAARPTHVFLAPAELESALVVIIRTIQQEDFRDDLAHLKKHNAVKKGSSLVGLSPFVDKDGIIRVGGRLEASSLSYDAKHPMLVPYNDPIVKLLMRSIHDRNLHCGPQALLAHTRQRFWPLKGKTMARAVVQHCITCCKARPMLIKQVMGNLPDTRVQPARPFINAGVDLCGPFWVHYKVRGKKPQKAYIVVFCCFATKAVHLELVTDLSTDAFIGSLHRFLGRRGHCEKLYCDNATNFVGARNKLAELEPSIYSPIAQENIIKACSNKGIDFKFIPPRAPHFGGLWEAAVKSAKHLLMRSLSTASLTYEELETVIIGVEAVLNSRPICPMSSDPNDLTALTPGHFLIGEPLTAQIDVNAQPNTSSLLRRWELVRGLKLEFWKRWSTEYLNQLQQKQKWTDQATNVEPGMMVVMKEDDRPVQSWPLGRIVKTIKGNDGMVRVAEVQTASGAKTRPIHRLAPLPVEDYLKSQTPPTYNDPVDLRNIPGPSWRQQMDEEDQSDDKNKPATQEIPKKRQKLTAYPGMLTIIVALLLLPLVLASPVRITKFKNAPGIHFEQISTIQPIAAEWNLIIYYDIKPIWKGIVAMHTGREALQHLCGSIHKNSSCHALIKQFDHVINELELNEIFLTRKRSKRGAIDLIGSIAHSLFGILDTEYAQQMANTIDHVKANEHHLLNLLKNQTSIIDATINIIKRDQAQVNETFGDLEKQINDMAHKIQEHDLQEYQQRLSQLVTTLSVQLTLRASSLQRVQALLIDVLIDTHHGKLSPMLLPVGQIRHEVSKIKAHLAPPLQLPIQDNDPTTFYKLMSIKGAATKDYFIFNIKLPLINQEQFHVFRLTPIPMIFNNTLVAINPRISLLAINNLRDKYLPITSEMLRDCIENSPDYLLCPNIQTIHTSASSYLACEVNLLNKNSNALCPLTRLIDEYMCVRLQGINQWIFAVKEPTNLNAVCGANGFRVTLEQTGLLELQAECSLRNTQLQLNSYSVYNTTSHLSYESFTNINISSDLPVVGDLRIHNATPYAADVNNLAKLQQLLANQQNSALPNEIQQPLHHPLAIGYTTFTLLIILTIIICWKWRFQWQERSESKNSRPTPAPRNSMDADFTVNV